MKQNKVFVLVSCFGSIWVSSVQAQNVQIGLMDAITNGETHFETRFRNEYVGQVGVSNDANAFTLRTKINYKTKRFNGISALIEAENITNLSESNFNDSINGKTTYPIVADPNETLVNRFFVDCTGFPKTSVTIGRQTINLNNQRHVGAVGWRQNDQTPDAIPIKNNSLPKTEVF